MDAASDGAPGLEFRGVRKSYGAIRALDGLDLVVPRGRIFGLLGPNGSGKSTLIRTALGLARPDSGDVRVLGLPMPSRSREALPRIGYMPQSPALYGELSVRENLSFFAAAFGVPRDRRRRAVEAAIDSVELTGRIDDPVRDLSGGMRQRASLACAMVHEPELLALDEPTVGVDPELRLRFWTMFRTLAAAGTTVLVSSHVMDEASRCDELAFLRAGRVTAVGDARGLVERSGAPDLEGAFLAYAAGTEASS